MSKKRRDRDFLEDINESIERIDLYIRGLTYRKFLEDGKTQDAVVRNFEIIGESSKNITAASKQEILISHGKSLRGSGISLYIFILESTIKSYGI